MISYSIEELHELFKSQKLDIQDYYDELLQEAVFQQQRLNAFVTVTGEKAYADIKNCHFTHMLNGIPFVLKDNVSTKGIKTTASSRMLENYIPPFNAHIVELLYNEGACLIGKASMDELGMGGTNKTALSGSVYNPWDSSSIAGGSSGGCAALVGSGVVPFAIGTDTGDSIRKPAGYCGVVGFKPTWGRISRYGVIPYSSSLDHVGALTRNVRDMAIVIECLAGYDKKDMTSSLKPVPHYLDDLDEDISHYKIAVLRTVSDELENMKIKNNFEMIVNTLKKLGASVENVEMSKSLLKTLLPAYTIIANAEATSNHACLDGIKYGHREEGQSIEDMIIQSRTHGFGIHIKNRFILGNLALMSENQEKMFKKAQKVRRLIVEAVNDIFKDYDIILTPNSQMTAPKVEDASDESLEKDNMIIDSHLCLANFAGTPSMTLPSGFVDGMPIAVHLMGRIFEEQTVFNVSYALENALGLKNIYSRED